MFRITVLNSRILSLKSGLLVRLLEFESKIDGSSRSIRPIFDLKTG